MDFPSSPQRNDPNAKEKKKLNGGVSVIKEQMKATEEAKLAKIRKFKLETVSIDTVSGEPLLTKMWVTEDDFIKGNEKEKEIYKCEICDKAFDKRQKMLLHARFHKK